MTSSNIVISHYASLIGPLIGLYYPKPPELDSMQFRLALNSSRLKSLWHSIYETKEVERQLLEYGGQMLPDKYAYRLDYDSHFVKTEGRERA